MTFLGTEQHNVFFPGRKSAKTGGVRRQAGGHEKGHLGARDGTESEGFNFLTIQLTRI